MTTGALLEPKALAGSMSLTPLTEMVVRTGAGSADLVCDEVFALLAVFLACDFCGGRAARSIPLSAANIRTVAKPRSSRRIKDSSESREIGEFKARVSQLSPVLGDGRKQDGEADMKMGCGGKKKGLEGGEGLRK
jgi:hypothetical protein